jgi:hypothetical protein
VTRPVAGRDPIVVFGQHGPVRANEYRAEWLVTSLEGLGSQFNATPQVP